MEQDPGDLFEAAVKRIIPQDEYIATLVAVDLVTGEAQVRRVLSATGGTVYCRVTPVLRATVPQLLVPGTQVVVKNWQGRVRYIIHVLDGEGAPPSGPITTPAQGNPAGLGQSAYGVPQSQIVPH